VVTGSLGWSEDAPQDDRERNQPKAQIQHATGLGKVRYGKYEIHHCNPGQIAGQKVVFLSALFSVYYKNSRFYFDVPAEKLRRKCEFIFPNVLPNPRAGSEK
jgi:hypothetical protein